MDTAKETLHRYLRTQRDALLWKLDGLGEYDLRRPMTPTGTNLLGLVKHVASVQLGYLGDVFGRPSGIALPWHDEDAEDNADMWATAEETTAEVLELWRRSCEHADGTVAALDLDAAGEVPWWRGERRRVTLYTILVHLGFEVARHAGHADIVRELIDGHAGLRTEVSNLPDRDEAWWSSYVGRLEEAANRAAGRAATPHA